ncbi:MAG TPA: hypothetical protein VNA66_09950 [Gammaproteobacteria bacterium]|nr:hypothetical protein [Gammaproteobacteria bacterium]
MAPTSQRFAIEWTREMVEHVLGLTIPDALWRAPIRVGRWEPDVGLVVDESVRREGR